MESSTNFNICPTKAGSCVSVDLMSDGMRIVPVSKDAADPESIVCDPECPGAIDTQRTLFGRTSILGVNLGTKTICPLRDIETYETHVSL